MATLIDVIEQVRSRIAPGADDEIQKYDYLIEQSIPNALREVALRVAESSDEAVRAVLQKSFTGTITSLTVDLTSHLNASEPLIMKYPLPLVTHSNLIYPIQPVPSFFRLQIEPASSDFAYYAIKANTMYLKDLLGGANLTTSLTIIGQFIPLLSTLPNQLLPILVEEVVALLKGLSLETEFTSLLQRYPRAAEQVSQ